MSRAALALNPAVVVATVLPCRRDTALRTEPNWSRPVSREI